LCPAALDVGLQCGAAYPATTTGGRRMLSHEVLLNQKIKNFAEQKVFELPTRGTQKRPRSVAMHLDADAGIAPRRGESTLQIGQGKIADAAERINSSSANDRSPLQQW